MKPFIWLALVAILMAGCGKQAEPPAEETPAEQVAPAATLTPQEATVKALVEKACALVLEKGQTPEGLKEVFARFEDPKGEFVQGEYYLYVYDLKGNVLSHEAQPQLIGKNLIDEVDANGVHMVADIVQIAKDKGSGWIDFQWYYPGTNEIKPKRAYIMRPGQMDMFIGSGFYSVTE